MAITHDHAPWPLYRGSVVVSYTMLVLCGLACTLQGYTLHDWILNGCTLRGCTLHGIRSGMIQKKRLKLYPTWYQEWNDTKEEIEVVPYTVAP